MEALMQGDWNEDRLERLERKVDEGFARMDHQFALIDQRFTGIDQRFAGIDQRFAHVDLQLKEIDRRIDRLERQTDVGFHDLHARFDRMQQTIIITNGGIIVALIAGIVAALVS
jgi:predicted  nucleic acid-binding Zn-ribbon protein